MVDTMNRILPALAVALALGACTGSEAQSPRQANVADERTDTSATAGTRDVEAVSEGDRFASVTVYKSPTCGCCSEWVEYLEENGFTVRVTDMPDVMPMKQRLGLPRDLSSCHTAVVGGYVVEGHVPADVMKRLLTEKPDVTGIAVPGMPIGSPGMEVPGRVPEAYDVVAFDRRGGRHVFQSIEGG